MSTTSHATQARVALCALLAAGVLCSGLATAHADPSDINTNTPEFSTDTVTGGLVAIRSVVYWSGANCIPIRAPEYPDGRTIKTNIFCGGYSEANYWAYPGEFVGADPMPYDGTTTSLGCGLYINGRQDNGDFAPPGDNHNVTCLRILRGLYDNGSAQSQA